MLLYLTVLLAYFSVQCIGAQKSTNFIKTCYKEDRNINLCLKDSANNFILNIKDGIPELQLGEIEPLIIDQIGISLGSGPQGYRGTFKNIEAYGISNITVTAVRSNIDSLEFQFTLYIPKIVVKAVYESSGILILVEASGGGNYWGEYEGILCKVYIKADPEQVGDQTFLSLQQIKMDFSVKDIQMGVNDVHNGNTVLQAALNLFINSNSQELLKEMKPDLRKKLLSLMRNFLNNIFAKIPLHAWIS